MRLCVHNRGPGGLAIGGASLAGTKPGLPARGRRSLPLAVLYPEPASPSWLDERRLDHVARRRRAPFGPATAWLALMLAVLAGVGAVVRRLAETDAAAEPVGPGDRSVEVRSGVFGPGVACAAVVLPEPPRVGDRDAAVPGSRRADPPGLRPAARRDRAAPSPNEHRRPPLSSSSASGPRGHGFCGVIGNPLGRRRVTARDERRADAVASRRRAQDDGGGAAGLQQLPAAVLRARRGARTSRRTPPGRRSSGRSPRCGCSRPARRR